MSTITTAADRVRVGDRIPDVSEFAVQDVSTSIPGLVIIDFGPWARHVHSGPEGFEEFQVERTESEEDYALSAQYAAICDVIDRVKTDERSLDTDEYASMILAALEVNS